MVTALDGDFNPRRLERYLVVASESGAAPVIVLNKADLSEEPAARVVEVEAVAPNVPVYAVSCRTPETLDPLRWHLGPGRTGALLGSSGVGKSTIEPPDRPRSAQDAGSARIRQPRPAHTSSNRQLIVLPDRSILIDTPGMREIQLWDTGGSMGDTFADIEAVAEGCRFRDCRHRQEPGAPRAAVEAETLASRLESFHKLAEEQAYSGAATGPARAARRETQGERIGSKAPEALKDKGRI